MIQLKQSVEKHIQDNWITTPVHYFGTDFDSSGVSKWLQCKFSPVSDAIDDSRAMCYTIEGLLELYTYAANLRDALLLAEEAVSLTRSATTFSCKSTVTTEQGTFDNDTWYVNSRITVERFITRPESVVYTYLVDGSGNYLLDSNQDNLII